MNSIFLKSNFSKNLLPLANINKQNNILRMMTIKNFSTDLSNNNNTTTDEANLTVKEKVIKSLDYKKIFKKKVFHRNFDVENTLNQFESYQRRDEQEMAEIYKKRIYSKDYLRVQNDWQKNLLKSKIRKGIIKYNYENYVCKIKN